MKKFVVILMCFAVCLLVGCNKDKDPTIDNILKIEVCSEFNQEEFYLNSIVNLSDYYVTVTYESGLTETINLTNFNLGFLDTREAGYHEINLTYKDEVFVIAYTVLEILPIDAMFKGEVLEFYSGETYDFSNIIVSVLFNDGHEENVSLIEFVIDNIDYSLTEEIKYFSASYKGVDVSIPYTVTNSPIVLGVDYNFDDSLNAFSSKATKIRFLENWLIVHNNTQEKVEIVLEGTASKASFNGYTTIFVVNGPKDVYLYLIGDTIYCKLIEE